MITNTPHPSSSVPAASYDMSRNESCFGPLPGVADAVLEATERVNQHRDFFASGLSIALSDELGVPAAHVVPGSGSAALLQQLLGVLAAKGGDVVHAWPSFESYPVMAANAGRRPVPVRLDDGRHDLTAMAAAATERTRVMLVCNPNNPTGTALRHQELKDFLTALPRHVMVIIDEAYMDFADPTEIADGIELYQEDERVCVVRTFSKAYGLLGARVGYAVAHPSTVAELRRTLPFFCVNTLGQAAALAALRAQGAMRMRCAAVATERDRLRSELMAQGWQVPESHSSFLWLPLGAVAVRFRDFCAEHGVSVWALPGEGVRVTVSEPVANDAFRKAADAFIRAEPSEEGDR